VSYIYNGHPLPPMMLGVLGWRGYYAFIRLYAHFCNLDGDDDE
jgi:hypothetical protein